MIPRKSFKSQSRFARQKIIIGGAKDEFGTRLCQRVECTRCGKTDYVAKRVANAKDKFCRACAETILLAYDCGRRPPKDKVTKRCMQCQCNFEIATEISLKKDELLCRDCLRGFDVWRGKVGESKKDQSVFKKRSSQSATIIRKVSQ